LTSILPNIADAKDIEWASDSSLIAFLADIRFTDVNELLVADPVSPFPSAIAISGTITSGDEVFSFDWAPDNSRIAFLADKKTPDQSELFSVRPDGSDLRVVSEVGASDNVIDYAWAPDASLLAYIADEDTAAFELFTARPDGSFSSIPVSGAAMAGDVDAFSWAPNSDFIAYRADQNIAGRFELFVALPGVTHSGVQVSGPMAPVLPNGFVRDFTWAPDSTRVAYLADQVTSGQVELFSSTPDGVTNDVVSGPIIPAAGDVQAPTPPFSGAAFLWSPDAGRLAYRADQEIDEVFEVFTSRPDGSENTKISQDLTVGKTVQGFEWGSEAF
jgi:Tol biopolymer transport system component